ncbi:MAG: hypothetical protein ACI9SJ_002205 [Flavobacteriaceae bacterium]|jgi:hypothetical protein|uniref:hypothetical protein n=1 Tax=Candidatus Marifrigoribacter sp. Uisw_064 TaxID=3230970 RepID=UPI003AEC2D8D
MRSQIVKILTWVLFLGTSANMLAQRSNAGSGPPSPTSQRTPELPLDKSIIVLICAGLILGCYVAFKNMKAKSKLD